MSRGYHGHAIGGTAFDYSAAANQSARSLLKWVFAGDFVLDSVTIRGCPKNRFVKRSLFSMMTRFVIIFGLLGMSVSSGSVLAQSFEPIYQAGGGEFEVELEIGGDIDDDDFMFQPSAMGLDGNDNLFVLDYKGYCVKKFDSTGRHQRTFGREGEGPGEMRGALRMVVDRAGRVIIYDFRLRRFTIFDNEGELLDTFGLTELGWRFIRNFQIDPQGLLYVESVQPADPKRMDGRSFIAISRLDLKSMEETPLDSVVVQESYVFMKKNGALSVSAPFYPELLWGTAPDGRIIVANSGDYRINFYSPGLELLGERRIESERTAVTEEDRQEYLDGWDDQETRDLVRSRAEFPRFKPYFTELHIDHEGYLLFQLWGDDTNNRTYDVLTPDGGFVNKVVLPRLRRSAILRDGSIYNIELFEEESWVVRRYRALR